MNADQLFNQALERAQARDYHAARLLLEQSEALAPRSAETLRLLGKIHLRLGDRRRACECWQKALKLDPGDAGSRACLETIRRFTRDRSIAGIAAALVLVITAAGAVWLARIPQPVVTQTPEVVRETPRAAPMRAAPPVAPPVAPPPQPEPSDTALPSAEFKARYDDAIALAFGGELAEARKQFESLAALAGPKEPLASNAHFWLGRCLSELGETEKALAEFERVADRWPHGPKAREALLDASRCAERLGRRAKAEAFLKRMQDSR